MQSRQVLVYWQQKGMDEDSVKVKIKSENNDGGKDQ